MKGRFSMVRSMTGYGRCVSVSDDRDISVELKSVNHRFLETNVRITRGYSFLEDKLKKYIQSRLSRGKVDVYVSIGDPKNDNAVVSVDHTLVKGYLNAFREIIEEYGLPDNISVTDITRYPDVLTVAKPEEDEDMVWNMLLPVLERAVSDFVAMRESEGDRLKNDILSKAEDIMAIVSLIEERSPQTVVEYKAKLTERIRELLEGADVDEQRIAMEVAIFADKVAVDEETVRLRSHFTQMNEIIEKGGPIGRKLDFVLQEMNREANTIGSKVTDSELAHKVVDIKAELEKIREQIQNIE